MRSHGTWLAALSLVLPALAHAAPGNAWHIPQSAEGGVSHMREPLVAVDAAGAQRPGQAAGPLGDLG